MNSLFSLNGKTALVTGASRGLGKAMAKALAQAGATVLCVSSQHGGCQQTVDDIRAAGGNAIAFAARFDNRTELEILVNEVTATQRPVDILVNNAGTISRHDATEFPMKTWDTVMQINIDAVFYLCQAFGRGMIERGYGKIINTASLLSYSGGIRVPAYTASKHAIAGLTKALANEWAAYNIQVNAIAPGYFDTDNTQQLRDDPVRNQEITARIPAGRWGKPEDLAGATVFLASAASDYVNGHVLAVDGGFLAR